MTASELNVLAVVLAAGQGTRLRSGLPKVLHRAAGRPLVEWVIDAAKALDRLESHHPVYTPRSLAARRRHDEINGQRRTY